MIAFNNKAFRRRAKNGISASLRQADGVLKTITNGYNRFADAAQRDTAT